jgi:hypothetical protein
MTPTVIAPAGDLDRVAFAEWLYAQPPSWTAQAESVSHNPLALWFAAQGYCLVQVGFSSAWLNYDTVDARWVRLGAWGSAFLDGCCAVALQARRNELTLGEVLLAVEDANWCCQATMILDRSDLRTA